MSYMLIGAVLAVAGLIWLMMKSRQLTTASSKLGKQRAAARAQFLKGSGSGLSGEKTDAPAKRPKFGQR